MKFIKTICNNLINFDDVYKIVYELYEQDRYYSYFYLRNGEKHDVFDWPEIFKIEDKEIKFDAQCYSIVNDLVLDKIITFFEDHNGIFDMNTADKSIWEIFYRKMKLKYTQRLEF